MHPSTQKGINFGRRCSHCIVKVGRDQLSTCSHCKYVGQWKSIVFGPKADTSQKRTRYCSKACQRAAWELHKLSCKTVADVWAEVHPVNVSLYVVLDAALTKWSQHWTFALHQLACMGVHLTTLASLAYSPHTDMITVAVLCARNLVSTLQHLHMPLWWVYAMCVCYMHWLLPL